MLEKRIAEEEAAKQVAAEAKADKPAAPARRTAERSEGTACKEDCCKAGNKNRAETGKDRETC